MKEGGGWVDGWRIWSASVVVVMAMLGEARCRYFFRSRILQVMSWSRSKVALYCIVLCCSIRKCGVGCVSLMIDD